MTCFSLFLIYDYDYKFSCFYDSLLEVHICWGYCRTGTFNAPTKLLLCKYCTTAGVVGIRAIAPANQINCFCCWALVGNAKSQLNTSAIDSCGQINPLLMKCSQPAGWFMQMPAVNSTMYDSIFGDWFTSLIDSSSMVARWAANWTTERTHISTIFRASMSALNLNSVNFNAMSAILASRRWSKAVCSRIHSCRTAISFGLAN